MDRITLLGRKRAHHEEEQEFEEESQVDALDLAQYALPSLQSASFGRALSLEQQPWSAPSSTFSSPDPPDPSSFPSVKRLRTHHYSPSPYFSSSSSSPEPPSSQPYTSINTVLRMAELGRHQHHFIRFPSHSSSQPKESNVPLSPPSPSPSSPPHPGAYAHYAQINAYLGQLHRSRHPSAQ
ncbi:MAG: hypothetical protein DHS80DRAFT_22802 [Piptocephalis tieghemiana]|nr:MAG: hypothetical protein DHS80DRAFT_22802 [Piptocephalis tieghemiana]